MEYLKYTTGGAFENKASYGTNNYNRRTGLQTSVGGAIMHA